MKHLNLHICPITQSFKWHNTTTHHDMHHQRLTGNYSLYFNFWDRVMGTNHPDYDRKP